jgi:hypothetical protein
MHTKPTVFNNCTFNHVTIQIQSGSDGVVASVRELNELMTITAANTDGKLLSRDCVNTIRIKICVTSCFRSKNATENATANPKCCESNTGKFDFDTINQHRKHNNC